MVKQNNGLCDEMREVVGRNDNLKFGVMYSRNL